MRFLAGAGSPGNTTHNPAPPKPTIQTQTKVNLDLPPNYTMSDLGWYDPFYSQEDY